MVPGAVPARSSGSLAFIVALEGKTLTDAGFDVVATKAQVRNRPLDVGGKLVRAVQSAALSDALRKGAAKAGQQVRCAVTPSDGRRSGRTAAVTATSR